MKLRYSVLDVFTDTPLAGNQLAVVRKADNLSDELMQSIAREFNLSETVFVRQPRLDYHAASLRIFTPTTELPFAGHPTIGTAVLLGLEMRLSGIRLEEKVGVVTCVMEKTGKRSGTAHFSLPQMPERLGDAPPVADMAAALGLNAEDIGCDEYEPALWSTGLPYYLVPVRDADVLARVKMERRGWPEVFPEGHHSAYLFTKVNEPGVSFGARMMTTELGFGEDPATGSAAAALIGLLSEHETDEGSFDYTLRQGYEMGRPSKISMRFTKRGGALERGGVGGDAIQLIEGELDLPV